ncbi:Mus7/MMS22 family protein [Colletotrichum zoysiae]|uniref:Mus7/MMS22 family protein n=1 Tax=Colletotrichum zoysiae TaxID=1216348 RepID=A0AAD9HQK3_9PEZI|nr:Mus7/MMS22 family protein [Colletotrichum zoysiae]
MANWKELGEVPDSDDELDFDSQDLESLPNPELPSNTPVKPPQTNSTRQSIWDVPESSQGSSAVASVKHGTTTLDHEAHRPSEQEPPSSPLSSVPDMDEMYDPFNLDEPEGQVTPPVRTRQLHFPHDRDDSPDPLAGDDSISTSYVKITAPQPEFPAENDATSLSPPPRSPAVSPLASQSKGQRSQQKGSVTQHRASLSQDEQVAEPASQHPPGSTSPAGRPTKARAVFTVDIPVQNQARGQQRSPTQPEMPTSRDEEVARQVAVRYERSFRPRKPIQEHPYLIENAQYSKVLKSHGIRPVRMPTEPAPRRQRADEESAEKDFEDDSQATTADVPNETTDESQVNGMDGPPSSGLLRLSSLSPSPSPLRTSSPKHCSGPSSQPSQGDTDNTSLSDNDELPSLDEIHRSLLSNRSAKKRKLARGAASKTKVAKHTAPDTRVPPKPTFQQYDEIYGTFSSPPSSAQAHNVFVNPPMELVASPAVSEIPDPFAEDDGQPTGGNMMLPAVSDRQSFMGANPPVFDLTMEDVSDAGGHDFEHRDVDMSGDESETGNDSGPETGAEVVKNVGRRMRGVLPASWLRLDQQASRPKPTQHQRPEASPEKMRRGVAVRRIGRPASSAAAAFIFEDSDDEVVPAPTPARAAHNVQIISPFKNPVTEVVDDNDSGSVIEDNQVDHMLPSKKRQLTIKDFHQPAKRQKTNDSTLGSQRKKPGRPPKAANRSSKGSRLDPWVKNHKSVSGKSRSAARAKTPPRLSILDVIEPNAPKFLKIAARTAQNRRHLGRSSPSNKTIRLATRKDNVDAGTVLQKWKGGKIRPRQGLQSKKQTTSIGRRPLTQLPSNASAHGAASSSKVDTAAQPGRNRREGSAPSTPLSEVRARARNMSRSHSTSSQHAREATNRPAQLETDLTEQPGRIGFHAKKRALDALFRRSQTQSLSSRSVHLDSFLDDVSSVVSGHSFGTRASPEPPVTQKPRLKRLRKPVQPIQIDVAAAHFRHANDPLPTTELLTPAETLKSVFSDNQLLGLGPFGTHYTQHFEIFPLDRGVFFHETTLIGSGRLQSAVDDQFPDKVWHHRPRISFNLGELVLRWDTWNEHVSSELGILMDGILDQVIKPAISTGVGFNAKEAARFVLDYVQKSMSFTNESDASSFVTRLCDVTRAFLSRLDSDDGLKSHRRIELVDILSNLVLVLSSAVRLCQKTHSLVTECFTTEAVLRKAAEALVQLLLNIGLDDVNHLYDDLQMLRYRERGIHSDKIVPHAWVLLMKTLENLRIPRMAFWDVTYSRMLQPSVIRGVEAEDFERLWKDMFTLLPLCEFNDMGVLISDRRHQVSMEGWNLPQQILKRVFQLYRDSPRQSPSFNDYCRALVSRCHYLVDQWGWQKCSGIIGTIFDFFGSQNLSHLRNEEAFRSARFLDSLHLNPPLTVEPEDRCFHIFLKLLALAIKRLKQKGLVNDIRNLVARTLPNHDRQYSKEQNVHQHDLAALRNHHDLLCTLFWAAPPDLRPGIHNLEKLVIPASSHKEACLINLRAWSQLARFVVHEESAASFTPLANWQTNVFRQLLDQHNSAAADIQQQFLALSKDASSNVSEGLMNSIVATNKAATLDIMLFSVRSSMDALQHAGSLELARLASSPYQLQQVFQHFSALPAEFPSALLQASLTTLERLLGRIESVFNEADDSQDSMASGTLESEDAILMLDRELATGFLSMARCLLSNQSHGSAGASSVPTTCVEQCVAISGMMIGLFVRCTMMTLSQAFKPTKYGLFGKTPTKLSWEQRQYLPLFLSVVAQKGAAINLEDIGTSLLQLWLSTIVQPSHCLRFENQFGQELQRQGYPFVPDRTAGLVVNPGYSSNRDFFEYAVSWMRQSYQTADAASKKNMRAEFEKVLNTVMNQMRVDVQILAADSPGHPSYVRFVRDIISLIKAHGTDICPVQKFFLEVSKEYSPPMQDPQLQAALIQSYGFKLAEGDPRIPSTLFHFFLNNFKGALQRDRLPHEVHLLKGALKHDAIMSFILGKMLPAVLHATLSSHEAYAMLDVLCDALGLALMRPTVARRLGEDSFACISALITAMLAWATVVKGTTLCLEHIHVLRRITWLLNAFQPFIESFSLMPAAVKGWDSVMDRLQWFSLLAEGAHEYLGAELDKGNISFLVPSRLFRLLRAHNEDFRIQDTTVLTWSEHIGNDISRNWVTTGPFLNVSVINRGAPSTQSGQGSLRPQWTMQELTASLYDQLRVWHEWWIRVKGSPKEREAFEYGEDLIF